jgi:hypothetical protein
MVFGIQAFRILVVRRWFSWPMTALQVQVSDTTMLGEELTSETKMISLPIIATFKLVLRLHFVQQLFLLFIAHLAFLRHLV